MAEMRVVRSNIDDDGADAAPNLEPDGSTAVTPSTALATPDTFANDGNVSLLITLGASASTMTVVTPITVGTRTLAVQEDEFVIPVSSTTLLGPFPVSIYADDEGETSIYFDVNTDLDVTAIHW